MSDATHMILHKAFQRVTIASVIFLSGMAACAPYPKEYPAMSDTTHMILHKAFQMNHVPILGSYSVHTVEAIEKAASMGMNTIIAGAAHLDPATPEGKACLERGIKVLYPLEKFVYHGVSLRNQVSEEQTEIPLFLNPRHHLSESRVIALDDELIRYERVENGALVGCERGWKGTAPARHREGTILFWPEDCEREVLRWKDSPNLLGWYVLDDSPGDARSGLRTMYRIVRKHDPEMRQPVCAGYGDAGSVLNFGPGICDIMLIYWYPVEPTRYMRESTSEEVQWILAKARERVPGVPFIGIFQSFDGRPINSGQGLPTSEQVREQMEDFVREGACGLIAFQSSRNGWIDTPELERPIAKAYREIRQTSGLFVRPETAEMAARRTQPQGFWRTPNHVPGYVPAWRLAAPFDVPEGRTLDAMFPPDERIDFDAVYDGPFGEIRWRTWDAVGGVMEISNLFNRGLITHKTAYAVCDVENSARRDALMGVSSDDDCIIRINGEEVYRYEGNGGVTRDKFRVPVTLPEGRFRLLVKCHNRLGGWGFSLRFMDTEGRPLEGLRFDPEWQ